MEYELSAKSFAQVANLKLSADEEILIEPGTAISWDQNIKLVGKLNNRSNKGLKGVLTSLGRGITSGESIFMTHVKANSSGGTITVAPVTIGCIHKLKCIGNQQYYLNTGSFLAADGTVNYQMEKQNIGKAIFGGMGGLFVMKTEGEGQLLINGFGDILEIELDNEELLIDNHHVLAWDNKLDYDLEISSGIVGFKTAEGIVNHFKGNGKIFLQTRNEFDFVEHLPKSINNSSD